MTSSPAWLTKLAGFWRENGHQLHAVGGAIRDQLLGRPVGEWDLTTDATPPETTMLLKKFGATAINLVGEQFGTVMAEFNSEKIEVTTYRSEKYDPDSRQPAVSFGQNILEDLSRRDFTINAIAYEPLSGQLLDPHHGQADLEAKIIRAVGDPDSRFREDPLRMLRAIRFAVQLGFTIDEATERAISSERERMGILSVERIRQEIDKLLLAKQPSVGVRMLVESGLINYILPELLASIDLEFDPAEHKDIYQHILQVLDNSPAKLELRWCALLHDIAKPLTRKKIGNEYHFLGHEVVGSRMAKDILRRLKYSTDFIDYVAKLVYLHQRLPNYGGEWTDGGIRRFVRDAGETLEDLFTFARADSTGKNEKKLAHYETLRQKLWTRIDELNKEAEIAKIKSPLSGEDLMTLFHRPPGPWIKPVKEHLLNLVLDGELAQSDKEAATKIARELLGSGRETK